MGYRGNTAVMNMDLAGFQDRRDSELAIPLALVEPTSNINFHEGGIGKRGGTTKVLGSAIAGSPEVRGIYQFRKQNGTNLMVFATSNGSLYHTNESNVLKTGMSISNKFSFSVFNDELYIADGSTVPQVWDGGSANTVNVAGVATDWASTGYPFQIVPHSRGANSRMWAIRKDAVYASKNNDGDDFSDANMKKIPVYSDSGLVGGFDFGGTLFVFSKTKTYIIDDTSSDVANWGYKEAQWEGGVAHFRLITKAGNNLYFMTDEGLVYSIAGVQATGEYESVSLTKPAHIDRWVRDNVTRANVDNFHSIYDRSLRCITYFLQVAGANTNTGLRYFIDRPPEVAWIIHDNQDYASGYNAVSSYEFEESVGTYKIYTGDFSGNIWKLEQSSQSDDSNPYVSTLKTKALNFDSPRTKKHFKEGRVRVKSVGNFGLTIRVWVDGNRREDVTLTGSGSGAAFDSATFDSSVFSDDTIVPLKFELGYYGFDIQLEILNNTANEDFFISQILVDYKIMSVQND